MKPRILHCIETGGPGGAETVMADIAANLDANRFESIAVVPCDGWLKQTLDKRGVRSVMMHSSPGFDASMAWRLASLCRQEKIDLIHSHLPDENFYSCLAGLASHKKVISTYHGSLSMRTARERIKLRTVARLATAVVGVSKYLAESLEQAGFPNRKLFWIHNGIDVERFRSSNRNYLHKELSLPLETKLVGMIANQRTAKSYDTFVRAAAQVVQQHPAAHFVSVGATEPSINEEILRLANELGIMDRFHGLGFRSDIPEILGSLSVFVLSSASEGFSIATIEAMASGRPVVVTRCGGPEELVHDGETGLLVPPNDPQAMADAIGKIIGTDCFAASLGSKAAADSRSRFSIDAMVRSYERLYERCIEGAPS
ncbi:MAG: glycosyltransferase [Acidobacteriaceae bacterium]